MKRKGWSGWTTCFEHHRASMRPSGERAFEGLPPPIPKGTLPAFRSVWILDAQWTRCPVEVEAQVKALWREQELGNDVYIIKTSMRELRAMKAKANLIVRYIREVNPMIDQDALIIIHWWW